MNKPFEFSTDLTIIGCGLAGLAAASFAVRRGIRTSIIGRSSAMSFASGLIDLMGVSPDGQEWDNPWEGIDRLRQLLPGHPYSRLSNTLIDRSLDEFVKVLTNAGQPYCRIADSNVGCVTSMGTIKKTHLVSAGMWNGIQALADRRPAVIVDFNGLKLFSARQIASSMAGLWPGLKALRVDFPGTENFEEVHPEHLARALDVDVNREKLAAVLRSRIPEGVEAVGFPAMLGVDDPVAARRDLESFLGLPVFEVPMPPVSVPGVRLQQSLERTLRENELLHSVPDMVKEVSIGADDRFTITVGREGRQSVVRSRGLILATGRFIGRGLIASRTRIREALLDLPVKQPDSRSQWHCSDLFDPAGHPINRSGVVVDDRFRPKGGIKGAMHRNLFVIGSILADSDWMRLKCGSGVAISTAIAAVTAFQEAH